MDKEKQAFKEWSNGPQDQHEESVKKFITWAILKGFRDGGALMAAGFYGGYHARDAEIARLNAEIERKDAALNYVGNQLIAFDTELKYDKIRTLKRVKLCQQAIEQALTKPEEVNDESI